MTDSTNLGDGLERLIRRVGCPLVRAENITTIPVNDPRHRTYRLWFEDGRQLKGRYYVSSRFAEVSRRIRQTAAQEFLPRVIAHEGDAMLEQWIDGETLASQNVDDPTIRECGRMQGRLHQTNPPQVSDLEFRSLEIADWAQMLSTRLGKLVEGRVLPEAEAQRLDALALAQQPTTQRIGIQFRDLCPENIVRDLAGRLVMVDTGAMTLGSIEEDLCRTRYRWPMTADQRRAFAAGYRELGDPTAFENPSMFWWIVEVVNSASFRLRSSSAAAMAVLERLNDLGITNQKS